MSYLVAVDAGHDLYTAGKRTPDGEIEWTFNNKVVIALIDELHRLGLRTIRLDDPSGQREVMLRERTNKANNAKADVLVSVHHNAFKGICMKKIKMNCILCKITTNKPKTESCNLPRLRNSVFYNLLIIYYSLTIS